jgi:hypothetical protein
MNSGRIRGFSSRVFRNPLFLATQVSDSTDPRENNTFSDRPKYIAMPLLDLFSSLASAKHVGVYRMHACPSNVLEFFGTTGYTIGVPTGRCSAITARSNASTKDRSSRHKNVARRNTIGN